VTLTVTSAELVPSSATEARETEQVAAVTLSVQVSDTFPLNPLGARESVKLAAARARPIVEAWLPVAAARAPSF
jgi:hypothetical protein